HSPRRPARRRVPSSSVATSRRRRRAPPVRPCRHRARWSLRGASDLEVLPALVAIRARGLAADAHRGERRVDDEEAVPLLGELVGARALPLQRAVAPLGVLALGPLLP